LAVAVEMPLEAIMKDLLGVYDRRKVLDNVRQLEGRKIDALLNI